METNDNATRIVISDLHLGKNDSFDIFKADAIAPTKTHRFKDFLGWCGDQKGPVELIINGDFVDFLQLRPWDGYGDRAQALEKAQEIAIGNSAIFQAFGTLIRDPEKRLTILLGNHDVELAYDEVWAVIQKAILGSASGHERLLLLNRVTQHNFRVGGVLVHVEHGNKGDPWNEILYKELFDDAVKNSGFHYPPGTLFVYDVMNKFKERFQFVDLLKPEVPAVPFLLARMQPLAAAPRLPKAALDTLRMVRQGFLGAVRRAVGGGAFARSGDQIDPLYSQMAETFIDVASSGKPNTFRNDDADHLEEFLSSETLPTETAVAEPSFGRRTERIKTAFVETILKQLGRPSRIDDKAFYQKDQSGHDVAAAEKEFLGDVRVVVLGHTHNALKSEIAGKGLYINSGTWANLIALPSTRDEFSAWLAKIADNTFDRTSFPTFVKLQPASGGLRANLSHWSTTGEDILWSKDISA